MSDQHHCDDEEVPPPPPLPAEDDNGDDDDDDRLRPPVVSVGVVIAAGGGGGSSVISEITTPYNLFFGGQLYPESAMMAETHQEEEEAAAVSQLWQKQKQKQKQPRTTTSQPTAATATATTATAATTTTVESNDRNSIVPMLEQFDRMENVLRKSGVVVVAPGNNGANRQTEHKDPDEAPLQSALQNTVDKEEEEKGATSAIKTPASDPEKKTQSEKPTPNDDKKYLLTTTTTPKHRGGISNGPDGDILNIEIQSLPTTSTAVGGAGNNNNNNAANNNSSSVPGAHAVQGISWPGIRRSSSSRPQQQQQQQQQLSSRDSRDDEEKEEEATGPVVVLPQNAIFSGELVVEDHTPDRSFRNSGNDNDPRTMESSSSSSTTTSRGGAGRRELVIEGEIITDSPQTTTTTTTTAARRTSSTNKSPKDSSMSPPSQPQQQQQQHRHCSAVVLLTSGAFCLLVLVVGLLGIFLTNSDSNDAATYDPNTQSPPPSPPPPSSSSETPAVQPIEAEAYYPPFQDDLPAVVLKDIEDKVPRSAYYKANRWMQQDPNLNNYSKQRQRQRFYLAVVYSATNGDDWLRNDHWLSYRVSECHWYSRSSLPPTDPYYVPNVCDPENDRIVSISLSSNNLTGTLPIYYTQFISGTLRVLDLGHNPIGGPFPTFAPDSILDVFILSQTNFVGTYSLTTEGYWPNLRVLKIDGVQIRGNNGGAGAALYPNIELLNSTGQNYDGRIWSEFGALSKVWYMGFGHTNATGTIPSQLGNLQALQYIDFSSSPYLTGALPSQMGLLTNLKYLDLRGTPFTGTIPTQLCDRVAKGLLEIPANCSLLECCGSFR